MACHPAIRAECHAATGSPFRGGTRPVSLAYSFRLDSPLPDAGNPRPVESSITQSAIAGSRNRVESTVRLISILSQRSMIAPAGWMLPECPEGAYLGGNRTSIVISDGAGRGGAYSSSPHAGPRRYSFQMPWVSFPGASGCSGTAVCRHWICNNTEN